MDYIIISFEYNLRYIPANSALSGQTLILSFNYAAELSERKNLAGIGLKITDLIKSVMMLQPVAIPVYTLPRV